MSSEITRENVRAFLDSNAINLKEAALEDQARQLRLTINDNHATKTMMAIQRRGAKREAIRVRHREEAAAREAERFRDMKAEKAVRYYTLGCLVLILLVAVTNLPLWAAVTLALGLGVDMAAYIYRIYVPLEVKK